MADTWLILRMISNKTLRISYTFVLNNVVDIVNRVVKRAVNEARKLPFFRTVKKKFSGTVMRSRNII
jgi:hypothetical protein